MPACSIDIQPDRITAKLAVKVLKNVEEPFPVSALRLDYSGTTQKRSNPAGNIQALLMLAGRRYLQPLSNERPTSAKSGMQGKTAFILKNNGFFRPQRFEFFLGPWRTSSRPRLLPGDIHDWLSSTGTRVDASNTAPDELSASRQSDAVSELPASARPSGRDSSRTSEAIAPNGVPTEPQFSVSSVLGVPSAFSELGLRPHPYSPLVSSGSRSSWSGPEPRIPILAAALPGQGARWRSLDRSRLLELSRPGIVTALWTPLQGFRGRFSCPQHSTKQG